MQSLCIVFFLVFTSLISLAENNQDSKWSYGFGLGPNLSNIDAVADDLRASYGAAVWMTRNWGERSRFDINLDFYSFEGSNRNYPGLSAAYGLRFLKDYRIKPFAMIGLGFGKATNFPRSQNANQWAPHLFARLGADKILEFSWVDLGLVYDYSWVKMDGKDISNAYLGLPMVTFSFHCKDEKKPVKSEPQIQPPAPVVAIDKDSDGDRVLDSKDECPGTPIGTKVNSIGCGIDEVIHKNLRVEFETSKSVILNDYFPMLDEFGDYLNLNKDLIVDIEGHTDNRGSRVKNIKLSQSRADVVRQALIERKGISADRIKAIGYGPDKPETTNESVTGRSQNRRVVAVIKTKK